MMIGRVIMLVLILVLIVLIAIYSYKKISAFLEFLGVNRELTRWKILNVIAAFLCTSIGVNIFNTMAIVMMHILAFFVISDLIVLIINKLCKSKNRVVSISMFILKSGIFALILTVVVLSLGYLNMTHIVETRYDIDTSKNVGEYKIALITDTHYGTIQDTQILKEAIVDISEQCPDIVVLGGDIVEDGTSKESMKEAFEVLGKINSKYGIYYVYGNHDRQRYSSNPSYTEEELAQTITDSGIKILKDEHVVINNEIVLVGRDDAAWGNTSDRATIPELLEGVDMDKYIVMLDHQPVEFEENVEAGVDLELSGHTHAGQIWPVGIFNEITGLNYGLYNDGKSNAIVSSGFAGWRYTIRTGGRSEYVIINIKGK